MKCKSSSMASYFSGFTTVQEIGVCRRFARLSTRLLLTFALAWSCILCSGQLALAETTPDDVLKRLDGSTTIEKLSTEEDVVLVEDEWPDGVIESSIKSKATPEGLVFAAKAGSKVALRIAAPDPVGPALTVLKSILSAVYTRNQAIWGIEQDLAWRWYQHEDKRAKVPVLSKNDHRFAALGTPTFVNAGNAQKQYDTWYSHAQQFYPIPIGYKLAAFGGGDWNPTGTFNIDDYEEYAKWYNYFEDVIETPPEGLGDYIELVPRLRQESNTYTAINFYEYDSFNDSTLDYVASNNVVRFNFNSLYESESYREPTTARLYYTQNVKEWMAQQESDGKKLFFYINNGSMIIFVCKSYTVTRTEISTINGTYDNPDSVTFEEGKYWQVSVSGNGQTVNKGAGGFYQQTPVYRLTSVPTGSGTSIATQSFYIGWITGHVDIDSGQNEPVYFQPTQDTIRPIPPTVTPENVTYVTYNQVSNTTTTVDLQPILDAIRNLDRNVQIGFDNVIAAIESCCDNMRTFLNVWLSDIFNWYDLMLNELQKQTRWLEAIYYSKANDVIVQNDDETDEGVDLQIQWENNLSQLERKFPLSIPWDLYGVLALLDAPPQAPVFTLPVVMTEYTVEVDLSDFEPMASISRKFSVLLFVVGLLMNTKKLISITIGEGMPD